MQLLYVLQNNLNIGVQMQKKKLTPKEIFRTLAFHYHLADAIPIQILAEMVSSLYYPTELGTQARFKYKKLLIAFMKQHNGQQKAMDQQKFVKFMSDLTKHSNDQYFRKLTDRIFNRYCNRQDDAIEEEGFGRMAGCFGIPKVEIKEYFLSVADLKNQISRDKFQDFMGSLILKR